MVASSSRHIELLLPTAPGGTVTSLGTPMSNNAFARNVWDLHSFGGKIFVGYGNGSGNDGPITIYSFEPSTQSFTAEYVAQSEELGKFVVLDGKLIAPDFDQRGGGGGFYRRDAGVWSRQETISDAAHTFDMVEHQGAFFAAISSPNADRNFQRSTDLGATWADVCNPVTSYWGFNYSLFVLNGVLYGTQEGGTQGVVIYQWTGTAPFASTGKTLEDIMPSSGAASPNFLRIPRFVEFAGKLVYVAADLISRWVPLALYRCDAGLVNPVKITTVGVPYDILVRGGTCFVLTWDGTNVKVWSSTDAVTWTEYFSFAKATFARSFEELNGVWYFGLGTTSAAASSLSGQILSVVPADGSSVGTVNATLGNVISVASGTSVAGTLARTLADAVVAASGGSSAGGTVARTLQPAVIQATGGQGVIGSVARTLANATVIAAGAFGGGTGTTGTVARTLDPVETASPLTDEFGDPILGDSGLPLLDENGDPVLDENSQPVLDTTGFAILVRGAEGTHGLAGAGLNVTLANITAVASGSTGGGTGTLARTLGNVTSAASGTQGVPGTLAVTLGNTTSAAAGTVGATGTVARSLADVTCVASGTSTPPSGAAGNLSVTLAAVVAAAGGSSTAGAVTRTLADLTSAASGTAGVAPVTGTTNIALADLTAQAAGSLTTIGTVNRTLAMLVADSVGSSVTGTLARTLANITSTTGGTGSHVDFQSVTIRERGHFVTIREMN